MRFKPTRAGIFNVWEYDDQTFEFGDGRLALRGRNGSGKSNALSLLFPFVLDGVMSAARMDPMGGGRSMKSLLLGRDDDDRAGRFRHDSGTGYVWMEFGNGTEYLTIGIGAAATQQRDADPWFFVTHQRVGHDLDLAENDIPFGRRQLQDRLADGVVYTTAEDYRSAVDRQLLGLGTLRYRRLVDLLLTLRRPHLAGKLDIEHLSSTLSAGLGELDASLIDDVAHSFDDLDAMQHQLEDLASALTAVERFLPVYRDHLLSVGRSRADVVAKADHEVRSLSRRLGEATRGREAANAIVTDLDQRVTESTNERSLLDGRIENIVQSPAYQSAVALDEVRRAADKAETDAEAAGDRAEDASGVVTAATTSVTSAQADLDESATHVADRVTEWMIAARSTGAEVAFAAGDFEDASAVAVVTERRHHHDEIEVLIGTAARTASESEGAEEAASTARDALVRAQADRDDTAQTTAARLHALGAERLDWGARLGAIAERRGDFVPERRAETAVDQAGLWFVESAGPREVADDTEDPSDIVVAAAAVAASATAERVAADLSTTAARALDQAQAAVVEQEATLSGLAVGRDRVADEPNPGPPPNPTRPDANDAERPGAPLYVCVEFAPEVDADARAGLEAALAASGLLDARVMPEDTDDDGLDASLLSGGAEVSGPSLADVLVPVEVAGLDAERIYQALRSVALDDDLVTLRADGSWRLGPVGGRFAQPSPEFIGHAAREARRELRLAALDLEIADATSALKSLVERSSALAAVLADVETLRGSQPATAPLEKALSNLQAADVRVDERTGQLADAEAAVDERGRAAEEASALLHSTAGRLNLPPTADQLRDVREALGRCDLLRRQISTDRASLEKARERLSTAERNLAEATQREQRALEEAAKARHLAVLERQRFADLSDNVGGDAQAAVEALAAARNDRACIDGELDRLAIGLAEAKSEHAKLAERIDLLTGQREAAGATLVEAEQRFSVICASEVAEVLALDGVGPGHDAKSAAKALLTTTEPPLPDATNQMEKAHREVLLDGLRAGYDPSMPKIDGVDVVRVGSADGDLPIGTLARQLRDEHERTAQLLTQNEREIFETHLLTRVGDSLRALLLDADSFEHKINEEMSKVPTESGMVVELRWEVSGDEPGLSDAVKSLRTAPEMLGPERREALRDFFMRRIADLRSTQPGRSFAETLTSALDYRSWHAFTLYARFATGKRQRVTRTFYRGLSGGEAATLLHLPLFAAAAAQYENGSIDGPRMIALDEAFVGIDDKMRARLMGLLTQLDLDVILTSHEFWGFYDTVPALVLYDLIRRPPTPGVYAQRFDWISDTGSSSHDATA